MRANPFTADSAFNVHGPRFGDGKNLTINGELYTSDEVLEIFGIKRPELVRMIESRSVPYINFGGYYFFPVEDIDAMPKRAEKYKEPSWVDIPPVVKISKLRKSGMTPAKIAKKLLVSVNVVWSYLETIGEVRPPAREKKIKESKWSKEYREIALRQPKEQKDFKDIFSTIQYMHLNKFTAKDIADTVDLNKNDIENFVKEYDLSYSRVKYVRDLEPSINDIIDRIIKKKEMVGIVAGDYGVSTQEMVKFIVAHKNSWYEYSTDIFSNPINRGIHRNPFTIKDGFRLFASISGRERISRDEELFNSADVVSTMGIQQSDLSLLVEYELIPHIMFGGEPFFPFSELGQLAAIPGPEDEIKTRIRFAKHFKSLQRNSGDGWFPLVVVAGLGLAAIGWWLSRRPA